MYDCIIIGKGPAGITTAIYANRSNIKCLVIGKDNTALNKASKIENYYGFTTPISGRQLFKQGIKQAINQNIEIKNDEVIDIEYKEQLFIVKTVNNEYETRAVVLATGANRKNATIENVDKFIGKGVSYCAVCDGYFFKNKKIAVIGSGEYALHEASILKNISHNITIFTNGERLPENRAVKVENVIEGRIDKIKGNKRVEKIVLKDCKEISVDAVFIAQGIASSIDFAKKLGIILSNNNIVVNEKMETNVPGIYAVGDCTGGLLQISKAIYEGSKCGLSIIKRLKL